MKKGMRMLVGFLIVVGLGTTATVPAHAAQVGSGDTVVDRVGDWFATMGKSGLDKGSILAQRRTERAAKRMEQAVHRSTRQVERSVRDTGRDIEKGVNDITRQ